MLLTALPPAPPTPNTTMRGFSSCNGRRARTRLMSRSRSVRICTIRPTLGTAIHICVRQALKPSLSLGNARGAFAAKARCDAGTDIAIAVECVAQQRGSRRRHRAVLGNGQKFSRSQSQAPRGAAAHGAPRRRAGSAGSGRPRLPSVGVSSRQRNRPAAAAKAGPLRHGRSRRARTGGRCAPACPALRRRGRARRGSARRRRPARRAAGHVGAGEARRAPAGRAPSAAFPPAAASSVSAITPRKVVAASSRPSRAELGRLHRFARIARIADRAESSFTRSAAAKVVSSFMARSRVRRTPPAATVSACTRPSPANAARPMRARAQIDHAARRSSRSSGRQRGKRPRRRARR